MRFQSGVEVDNTLALHIETLKRRKNKTKKFLPFETVRQLSLSVNKVGV